MDAKSFSDRVLKYALSYHMFEKGDKVVAGVSGGADSMCLLGLLIDWRESLGLNITVLHVNHGIRGAEADSDEEFVRRFCADAGVDFRAVHADIPGIAKASGCTEEEAGRNFRYQAFTQACRETGSSRLAVAHNMNDNAETVLFNLARGSGLAGMAGIAPSRVLSDGIELVRPLLASSRSEIEEYLSEKGIGHVTDSTNLENDYSRNCLRNLIIPVLNDKVNSKAESHIAGLAAEVRETEGLIAGLAAQVLDEVRIEGLKIDAVKLADYSPVIARRVIRLLLGEAAGRLKDIERIHIDAVLELLGKDTGRSLNLPYGIRAVTEYGVLRLVTEGEEESAPGQIKLSIEKYDASKEFPKNLYTKWFDYDKIKDDIAVRTRQSGDYLMIRMNGGLVRKELSRWFIDNRIPKDVRERVPLLAAGSHVLWVCGYRRDDTCLVDETTERVLVACMEEIQ